MIIQSLTTLTSLKPLYNLAKRCEERDGYSVKIYWNLLENRRTDQRAFDYLYFLPNQFRPRPIGLLNLFYFQDGAEITGMVDPDYRHQHIFSNLMKNALNILRTYSIPSYLVPCNVKAESLNKKYENSGAKFDHREIEMEGPRRLTITPKSKLTLQPAVYADMPLLIDIHRACFPGSTLASIKARLNPMLTEPNRQTWIAIDPEGTPIGKIHVREDESAIFLHDLGIIPAYQNRGYGASLVHGWYQLYEFPNEKPIMIDVLGENTAALRLYANCGFKVTNEYNFWRFNLNLKKSG